MLQGVACVGLRAAPLGGPSLERRDADSCLCVAQPPFDVLDITQKQVQVLQILDVVLLGPFGLFLDPPPQRLQAIGVGLALQLHIQLFEVAAFGRGAESCWRFPHVIQPAGQGGQLSQDFLDIFLAFIGSLVGVTHVLLEGTLCPVDILQAL